jgi:hypothetical protein
MPRITLDAEPRNVSVDWDKYNFRNFTYDAELESKLKRHEQEFLFIYRNVLDFKKVDGHLFAKSTTGSKVHPAFMYQTEVRKAHRKITNEFIFDLVSYRFVSYRQF